MSDVFLFGHSLRVNGDVSEMGPKGGVECPMKKARHDSQLTGRKKV
jgi:hypothetical protein